jgi:hypothetical protein
MNNAQKLKRLERQFGPKNPAVIMARLFVDAAGDVPLPQSTWATLRASARRCNQPAAEQDIKAWNHVAKLARCHADWIAANYDTGESRVKKLAETIVHITWKHHDSR